MPASQSKRQAHSTIRKYTVSYWRFVVRFNEHNVPLFCIALASKFSIWGGGGWSKHEYGVRPVVNAIPRCGAWFICGSLDAHCRPELPSLLLALPPLTST